MPLPRIKIQCKAKAKHSQLRCLNPAAFGCTTCRLHGARRPETILKGTAHPNYRHGQETSQVKAERSAGLVRLRELEDLLQQLGMTRAKKTPGIKPR